MSENKIYITFLIVKTKDSENFSFWLDKKALIQNITYLDYKDLTKNQKTFISVLSNFYLEPYFFLEIKKPFLMLYYYKEYIKFFNNFVP